MCGIVGILNYNGITQEDIDIFTGMLERCEVRGHDATGCFNQKNQWVKGPYPSRRFVKSDHYKRFCRKSLGCLWIVGHCRWSTQGDPSVNENNHPVSISGNRRFHLVHNGVVRSYKYKVPLDVVDTMSAVLAVDDHFTGKNLLTATTKGLADLFGDGAFIIGSPLQLVVAKTRGRPMKIFEWTEDWVAFGSTKEIIGYTNEMKELPPNTAISFDVNKKRMKKNIVKAIYNSDYWTENKPKTPTTASLLGFKKENYQKSIEEYTGKHSGCFSCDQFDAETCFCNYFQCIVAPEFVSSAGWECSYDPEKHKEREKAKAKRKKQTSTPDFQTLTWDPDFEDVNLQCPECIGCEDDCDNCPVDFFEMGSKKIKTKGDDEN